jgi:hypothetical protein
MQEMATREYYDRSTSLGYRYYDYRLWCNADATRPLNPAAWTDGRQTYALDPLYCANNAAQAGIGQFPFNHSSPGTAVPVAMQRVTMLPAGAGGVNSTYFDRIFTSPDDLVFGPPVSEAARPTRMMNQNIHAIDGAFSWMATVTPQTNNTCVVSVAVFHRRSYDPPGAPLDQGEAPEERTVMATFPSGFTGGGPLEITLTAPSGQAHYLSLREVNWLLLCGREPVAGQSYFRNIFRWYRIVASSSIDTDANGRPYRFASLVGDVWRPNWCIDYDGDSNPAEAQAVLLTGLTTVQTQTLALP